MPEDCKWLRAVPTPLQRRGDPIAWVKPDIVENQFINMRPRRVWWECNEGIGMAIYTAPQPAEPVKVPSDNELLELSAGLIDTATSNEVIDFARTLLARYGNQENSNGGT